MGYEELELPAGLLGSKTVSQCHVRIDYRQGKTKSAADADTDADALSRFSPEAPG